MRVLERDITEQHPVMNKDSRMEPKYVKGAFSSVSSI